jgi:hypothetical protein
LKKGILTLYSFSKIIFRKMARKFATKKERKVLTHPSPIHFYNLCLVFKYLFSSFFQHPTRKVSFLCLFMDEDEGRV